MKNSNSGITSDHVTDAKSIAQSVVEFAVKAGADAAEVLCRQGMELTAKVRLGEPELVQEAGSRALGLRIFKGGRAALTYTSDMRREALEEFAKESVTLADLSEPDEFNYLPARESFIKEIPDLDLYDEKTIGLDASEALARAKAGEAAALAFDKRVSNSDGATWSRVLGAVAFANSEGFVGGYRGSYSSLYVEPLCDDEDGKKRNGYWWTGSRFLDSLDAPEKVGEEAARRTVAKLGARKVESGSVPVVFDPEAARQLVGMIFSVANGSSFYRKSSTC